MLAAHGGLDDRIVLTDLLIMHGQRPVDRLAIAPPIDPYGGRCVVAELLEFMGRQTPDRNNSHDGLQD